jgi:glycosyltransferase involved in cell wall biosynthesis
MKILFLIDEICVGGKERRMIELIKGLLSTGGYEITLVYFTPGIGYPYLLDMPIRLLELKRTTKKDLSIFSKLYRLIRNFKPDVIHSWGSMSSIYVLPSVLLYRRAKFINGIIADAPENLTIKNEDYLRGRLTFPFSDAIVSNTHAGIRSYKAQSKKSHCIYNGMDPARFINLKSKQSVLDSIGLKADEFIVGMIAVFEDRKDYETIIKAAAKLQEQKHKIKILLIGDGMLKKSMEELADSLKVKNVLFLGHKPDVENYIQLLNAGVLTTNHPVHCEGISNSLIECMALGKPIIGTAGGGTNELINDGYNGYLIPPKNPELLAERILYLFNHQAISEEMGRNGLKMAMEKFTLDRMTKDFINVYNAVSKKL